AEKASEISTIDFVRSFLVKQQQEMGKDKRLVMDGRDIGTVVFPNADIKFFIEASLEERTLRRYNELIHQNKKITIETVKKSLIERDLRDTTRAISPLKKAKDAILIDNTNLTRTEQLAIAKTIISEKFT
ncbi:MAG TPA: cytidylate kinase, partial [Bacteroidales bacterium]|nr:cytidylate kinase [Bacteroidales bacterium]